MTTEREYPEALPGEGRYVEFDDEFEWYGIFGEDSGHCYHTFIEKAEAEAHLEGTS